MSIFMSNDSSSKFGGSMPSSDPKNYKIIRFKESGDYVLIEIKYNDVDNYEGRKIILFKAKYYDLVRQKTIDPHFSDNSNFITPIARFEPTPSGWTDGLILMSMK